MEKKIVCISDTHSMHKRVILPEGDILIHAGDISNRGTKQEIEDFNTWLGTIKHNYEHIIMIAGNHDFGFQDHPVESRNIITNAIYLENEGVEIDGIKFWGSPITPWFHNWAFNKYRGDDIKRYWDMIPNDTNVLITHTPTHGIQDEVEDYHKTMNVGCEELTKRISGLTELKLFVCGHIHEGYGVVEKNNITYVNASVCNTQYKPYNLPIIYSY